MPAPSFLAKLPKPALFGLYGAVGGLLGALVVGELVWSLLRPPPPVQPPDPPPPPPQVAVTASPRVALYPGTENTVEVQVARDRFDGPATVSFDPLPPGLSAPAITVPAGRTSGRAQLAAAAGAKPGTHLLTATATGGAAAPATAAVEVTVVALPPVPPRLVVTASPKVHVFQGDKNAFGVQVARAGFDGPVTVQFTDAPEGVTLAPLTIPAKATTAEAVVIADRRRKPGEWQVGVRADAPLGGQGLTASTSSVVRVEPVPVVKPQLVVTASPEVHVYVRAATRSR